MDPFSTISVQIAEDYLTAVRRQPLPFKSRYFKGSTPVTQAPESECDSYITAYGGDEYRCSRCGILWGRYDARPPCQRSTLK